MSERYTASESKKASLEETSKKLLTAIEKRGISREAFKRLAGTAQKVARYTLMGVAFIGLAGAANHMRTRYEVSSSESGGEIRYTHPDQETTQVMNFLTGAAEAPEEFKLLSDRATLERLYETRGYELPLHLSSMTREQIRENYMGLLKNEGEHHPEQYAREILEAPYARIPFDPDIYQAAWETLGENGAPRLRLANASDDTFIALAGNLVGAGRAMYDPVSNTLYINPSDPRRTYLDEMAHARQFDRDPFGSYGLLAKEIVDSLVDAVRYHESPQQAQTRQYDRPDTLESNAHGVRRDEPVLSSEDLLRRNGITGEILDDFEKRYHEHREHRLGPAGDDRE